MKKPALQAETPAQPEPQTSPEPTPAAHPGNTWAMSAATRTGGRHVVDESHLAASTPPEAEEN